MVLIVIGIMIYFVLSLPTFGGKISGDRLKRLQDNEQYKDGRFTNVKQQSPFKFSEIGSFLQKCFSMMKSGFHLLKYQSFPY